MMASKTIFLILIISLLFISGCVENKDTTNLLKQDQQDEAVLSDSLNTEYRKNCRELNGYLCGSEGQCALPWLDSSDSYCCPIECNVCTKKITDTCKTNDLCVEAICGLETDFNCEFRDITPCANNGICEKGEIETCLLSGNIYTPEETITGPALCCPDTPHAVMSKTIESSDCPKNCDDGRDNTADYYNFTAQKCEHYAC